MDYKKNLEILEDICDYKEDGIYWMNKATTKGYGVSISDFNDVSFCAFCEHWQGKRGIGYAGKWVFKKLSIYIPIKHLCSRCSIDGDYHDLMSSNEQETGRECRNFKTVLPSSYNGLPEAANDITL